MSKETKDSAWQQAFRSRFTKSRFGDDAIGIFALGLRFGIEDLDTLGAEIITGGTDDKKCDLMYFDSEESRCVIAQCYVSKSKKEIAPANKASDLNTAVTWLLSTPIADLPEKLRPKATRLREAIANDKLRELYIWYIHNVSESINVRKEIQAVEHSAKTAIKSINQNASIQILAREFGDQTFEQVYRESESPILVTEEIALTVEKGFIVSTSKKWAALVTHVDGSFLYDLFEKHGTNLFSANIRDYLGSRDSDSNINFGIKSTAENKPEYFWAFNNGVTALVNRLAYTEKNQGFDIKIEGLSIVNGAQTTGAIGSLDKRPSKKLQVPVRFIWTKERDTVEDIIKFNNSQNKVSASDFRSNDSIQKRLKDEFRKIPSAEYEGGRRGSASDAILRRPNLLASYTVGQALAAFHGDPVVAYERKSEIWINDRAYSSYFKEETTARHIVLAYSLYKAVGAKKIEIIEKQQSGQGLTQLEKEQLDFIEKQGAILLTCAAISDCLETVIGRPIPNKFRLSFGERTSPAKAADVWEGILNPLFSLVTQLNAGFAANRVSTDHAKKAIGAFRNLAAAVSTANRTAFKKFSDQIRMN